MKSAWLAEGMRAAPAALGGVEAPLDLRGLVFGLLALGVLLALAAVALDRRLRREPRLRGLPGTDAVLAALERAPLGLLLLEAGASGAPRFASREARKLLGLVDGAMGGSEAGWRQALDEDRAAARCDAGQRQRELELDAGRVLRWWVCPLGALDLVAVFDQSARHAAERSGRLMLGDLAHELRTPLATLATHLEVQAAEGIPSAARAASLQLARAEALRMRRLVQDMLALGRLEAGGALNLRPVDAFELAEEALARLRPAAEEAGLQLALAAEGELPRIEADPDALLRVISNLLDNAIRHGGAGGWVRLSLAREALGLRCQVDDGGPGIPAEDLPRVTRRFQRGAASAETPGSGLGLAMGVEILRQHGTRLELESPVPGATTGCRASFWLPEALA